MFLDFFLKLKDSKIPVTLNEFLSFLSVLDLEFVQYDMNKFYYLARTSLVKDEKLFDKFDLIFGEYFKSIEKVEIDDIFKSVEIPKEWLNKLIDKNFSEEEINKIKSIGGLKKLIETLKKRLEEQKKRHQGGNKWIGTSGTSPFGAYGYNPKGVRIGQYAGKYRKAVKVWDKRIFKDFDDTKELDIRGMQVALKRLRQWARISIDEEIDIKETIDNTVKNGYLDIRTRKERENNIKILIFLDVGGSMDDHVKKVENLFSAAKNAFKNLKYFYFHNCLYESVWKNNARRWTEQFSTLEIIRTYGSEYKCIFVGDATMSPYEILAPGGGNEHFNEESGKVWLERAIKQWPANLWINPVRQNNWYFSESTSIIKKIFSEKMVPLSLQGITEGTRILSNN